jgi:hypothetical protein
MKMADDLMWKSLYNQHFYASSFSIPKNMSWKAIYKETYKKFPIQVAVHLHVYGTHILAPCLSVPCSLNMQKLLLRWGTQANGTSGVVCFHSPLFDRCTVSIVSSKYFANRSMHAHAPASMRCAISDRQLAQLVHTITQIIDTPGLFLLYPLKHNNDLHSYSATRTTKGADGVLLFV